MNCQPSSAEIIRSTFVPPPLETARASISAALNPSGWKRSGVCPPRLIRSMSHLFTLLLGATET
jgi:hypothetical protein